LPSCHPSGKRKTKSWEIFLLGGINGIVIGPLVAALFIALWSIFSDMQQGEGEPQKAIE
jgi:hypothetical protein